jgi:hypothetical protein
LNLVNVTISGNTSTGTPLPTFPNAAVGIYGSTVNFTNRIVANTTPKNCSKSGNGAGTIGDNGYNLDGANDCGFTTGTPKFDKVNTDPLLAALANNGGPTDTMALGAGSPALDAAGPSCPPPATDQRGITRPQGTACDMGAFELVVVVPSPSPTATALPLLPKSGQAGGTGGLPAGILAALLLLAVPAVFLAAWHERLKRSTS